MNNKIYMNSLVDNEYNVFKPNLKPKLNVNDLTLPINIDSSNLADYLNLNDGNWIRVYYGSITNHAVEIYNKYNELIANYEVEYPYNNNISYCLSLDKKLFYSMTKQDNIHYISTINLETGEQSHTPFEHDGKAFGNIFETKDNFFAGGNGFIKTFNKDNLEVINTKTIDFMMMSDGCGCYDGNEHIYFAYASSRNIRKININTLEIEIILKDFPSSSTSNFYCLKYNNNKLYVCGGSSTNREISLIDLFTNKVERKLNGTTWSNFYFYDKYLITQYQNTSPYTLYLIDKETFKIYDKNNTIDSKNNYFFINELTGEGFLHATRTSSSKIIYFNVEYGFNNEYLK